MGHAAGGEMDLTRWGQLDLGRETAAESTPILVAQARWKLMAAYVTGVSRLLGWYWVCLGWWTD